MDDTDPKIIFTKTGCNHCDNAIEKIKLNQIHVDKTKKDFFKYLDKIKNEDQ